MANQLFLSNDTNGYTETIYCESYKVAGNITSTLTSAPLFAPNFSGKVVGVVVALGQNGVDGSNALSTTVTVSKNGTAVTSTDPAIAKAAGTGVKSTASSGTGITQAVVKTDGTESFVSGDYFSLTNTVARTASPSTEMANLVVHLFYKKTAV